MKRLPLAAVVCIAILAGVELYARLRFTPGGVSAETYSKYYPAYDYGFSDAPVCWPVDGERSCLPTPYLNVLERTFPLSKEKNERRIFTIGSSVSRGSGGLSYSQFLESDLDGQHDQTVHVINLSASSTGSARQLLRVKEALKYQPDLIIVHVHIENEYKDERDAAYSKELHRGLGGLALHSRAVVALKKWYSEKTETEIATHGARDAPDEREDTPDARERWEQTLVTNTSAMLNLCRKHHVPVVLLGSTRLYPGFVNDEEASSNARVATLGGKGVVYIDLPKALAKVPREKAYNLFSRDGVHFSGFGHKVVARALGPVVRKLLWRDR